MNRSRGNIFIFEPAGQIENTGDLLINKAALDILRARGSICISAVATPGWFIDEISQFTDRRLTVRSDVIDMIKESTGAGYKCYYVLPPGHITRSSIRSSVGSIIRALKVLGFRRAGASIIRAGFSIGPFDAYNAFSEKFISKGYALYGLRDRKSVNLAVDLGFSNVRYFPDYAWAYSPDRHFSSELSVLGKGALILSFRSNINGVKHDSAYLAPYKDALREMVESGALDGGKIVISYQVLYDREGCLDIYNHLKDICGRRNVEIFFLDRKLLLKDANSLYSQARSVISNRLHVLLLGAMNGVLPIPLINPEHNKKIVGILEDNQLGEWICDIRDKEIARKILDVIRNSELVISRYAAASKGNAERINKILSELIG